MFSIKINYISANKLRLNSVCAKHNIINRKTKSFAEGNFIYADGVRQ